MNFELTQQQKAIQETARKFAQEELLPGVLERDAKSEFPVEQFHKMGELGLIGLPYPKEVILCSGGRGDFQGGCIHGNRIFCGDFSLWRKRYEFHCADREKERISGRSIVR